MSSLPEPWMSILQGAATGAAVGGGLAAANFYMKKQRRRAVDLKVPARALSKHRELVLLVGNFTPLRDLSGTTRGLYDTMVGNIDLVLAAEESNAKGSAQYRASRAAQQAGASAKLLCTEAAKLTQRGVKCETDPFEVMRDVETLEAQVNNHLHNIMLQ